MKKLCCLLAILVLSSFPSHGVGATGSPPPPSNCPSCTINIDALAAANGWAVQYWVDADTAPAGYCCTQFDKPTDNRGLALSPTGQYLYAGYNTGNTDDPNVPLGSQGEVRMIDTLGPALGETAVVHFLYGYRGKAIATDPQGRVYLAEGLHESIGTGPFNPETGEFGNVSDLDRQVVIFNSTLTTLLFSFGSTGAPSATHYCCFPAGARPEGVTVIQQGTTLVLYITDRNRNVVYKFTTPVSSTSWTFQGETPVAGAASLRGIEVDPAGRIWIADPNIGTDPVSGFPLASGPGGVFILNSDLTFNTFRPVPGALDVAFDAVNAFVTQGPNLAGSEISVISHAAPAFAPGATLLRPPYESLNIDPNFNAERGIDPRLSGIVVACPIYRSNPPVPGFYVADEGALAHLANTGSGPRLDREPIIKAQGGTFTPCPSCGKVTGGGQISVPNGYANFGFNAQVKEGVIKGSLEYLDHSTGANYHSIQMLTLTVSPDLTKATFTGTIKKKGDSTTYYFKVYVEDNGEGSPKTDVFQITIYSDAAMTAQVYPATPGPAGGVISRGNIQIHKKPVCA